MPPTFRLLSRTALTTLPQRQVVGAQAIRIDVDLVLLDRTTDRSHLRNSGHCIELVANEPVLERPQFAERQRRALDRVPEDMAHAGGIGAQGWRDAGRERFRDEAHSLQHARPCEVQVDLIVEDHVDHREPEGRLRTDHAHAGESLQVDGQRVGDLVLHLLRAVTRPVGEDNHLVIREIRNRVNRRGAESPPSPASQPQVEREHDETVAKRQLDQSIDHEQTLVTCRAGVRDSSIAGHASGQIHDDCRPITRGRRRGGRASEPTAALVGQRGV